MRRDIHDIISERKRMPLRADAADLENKMPDLSFQRPKGQVVNFFTPSPTKQRGG